MDHNLHLRHSCTSTVHAASHVWSPPYYPESNVQAEHFVDTFKYALLKAKENGITNKEILSTFLISYQTTPNATVKNGTLSAEGSWDENSRLHWMPYAHKNRNKGKTYAKIKQNHS